MSEISAKRPKHPVNDSSSENVHAMKSTPQQVSPKKRKHKESPKASTKRKHAHVEHAHVEHVEENKSGKSMDDTDNDIFRQTSCDGENAVNKSDTTVQQAKKATKQELTYYIGKLSKNFEMIKAELENFLTEKSIKIENLEGHAQANFCHCILSSADDRDKILSLDGTSFLNKSLIVAQATQYKNSLDEESRKVCLLDVSPEIVTVDKLKEKTNASDAVIVADQRLAYLMFQDTYDARKLMLTQYLYIDGCKMKITKLNYKSAHRDKGFKKVRTVKSAERPCHNCGETGHLLKSCPLPAAFKKSSQRSRQCFKCGKSGHIAVNCKSG